MAKLGQTGVPGQAPQPQQQLQYAPAPAPTQAPDVAPPFQQPAPQAPQGQYATLPEQYAPQQPQAPQPQYAPQQPAPVQQFQPAPVPQQAPPGFPPAGIASGLAGMMGGPLGGAIAGGMMNSLKAINFNAVEDKGGIQLLPLKDAQGNPITYEGIIVKATGKATAAGADMIELQVKVSFPVEFDGAVLYDNVTFGDTALWKLKSLCKACEMLDPNGSFSGQSEQDFVGEVVRFQTRHDEYPEGSGQFKSKIAGGYATAFQTPGLAAPAQFNPLQNAPQGGQPNFGAPTQ